jgi:adenosylhomocysteine nucleosidase
LTNPVVGVVCALRSEARHLGRTTPKGAGIEALPDGQLIALTGMGPRAAARGADALISAGACALVSFGMAGGLDPQLGAGRIFLPSEVLAPDGALLPSNAWWRARVALALAALAPVSGGRLVSVPVAVTTVDAKSALLRASGARAVDMESSAVAALAYSHALPFLAVRVIVDDAAASVPGVVTAATGADGQISVAQLCAALLRRPQQLGALLRLARGYFAADRALAAAAASGALWPAPSAASAGPRAGLS